MMGVTTGEGIKGKLYRLTLIVLIQEWVIGSVIPTRI